MVEIDETYTISGEVDGVNIEIIGDHDINEFLGVDVRVLEKIDNEYYKAEKIYSNIELKLHKSIFEESATPC